MAELMLAEVGALLSGFGDRSRVTCVLLYAINSPSFCGDVFVRGLDFTDNGLELSLLMRGRSWAEVGSRFGELADSLGSGVVVEDFWLVKT